MLSRRLTAPLQAAMPWVSMLSLTSSGTQNSGGSVPLEASTCAVFPIQLCTRRMRMHSWHGLRARALSCMGPSCSCTSSLVQLNPELQQYKAADRVQLCTQLIITSADLPPLKPGQPIRHSYSERPVRGVLRYLEPWEYEQHEGPTWLS